MSILRRGSAQHSGADVFICHASSDKDVVRPLAEGLRDAGLSVWYDDFVLRLGDSLREELDRGLRDASFGLVVLSPSFFARRWPQWELNALVERQIAGRRRIIIPVWHKISADEVRAQSPSLVDLVAGNTASGVPRLVAQILDAVGVVGATESSFVPGRGSDAVRPRAAGSAATSALRKSTTTVGADTRSAARPTGVTDERITGVVKWWNDEKGYGFLTPSDGSKDVFVHHTHLLMSGFRTLHDGQHVEFRIEPGDKGPKAADVRPL